MKKLARRALRRAGLERIRTPSLAEFLALEKIATVLDVGANEGQFALELRELSYKGKLISFEPIAAIFATLQARAARDPLWEVHNVALGAVDGEQVLNVADRPVFSSFREPTTYVSITFAGSRKVREEAVKLVRLDTFLAANPEAARHAFLKVDTQGYEEEVLLGAGERIQDLAAIQLELPIRPLYEQQKSWVEIIGYLADAGFSVAMVKENSYDWDRMRLLELDVVFTNDRFTRSS